MWMQRQPRIQGCLREHGDRYHAYSHCRDRDGDGHDYARAHENASENVPVLTGLQVQRNTAKGSCLYEDDYEDDGVHDRYARDDGQHSAPSQRENGPHGFRESAPGGPREKAHGYGYHENGRDVRDQTQSPL